jgi:branched-chain amino acid transport system permease protein
VSAQAHETDLESIPRLKRLWDAGPYGWNQALTKPQALFSLLLVAASIPLLLEFIEANSAWIGAEFWTRILATAAMYACLAVSLNLVVGYAGLLNLGFIAFFAIGSYAYALAASDQIQQHLPLWSSLITVVAVTLGFALLAGVPSLRLRGDYLAIVTLAFGLIMRELTIDLDRPPVLAGHQFGSSDFNLTGGTAGIHLVDPFRLPAWVPLIHGTAVQSRSYYWVFLGFLAISVFCVLRWRGTRSGRAWVAIRDDELAARAMGVNTFKYRLLAFCTSAVMAGIVGMIDAAYTHNTFPDNFDIQQTVLVFIMVVLGGLGSIPGSILGAAVITILPFTLQQLVLYKYVVFSLVLIVLMIFRPEGLLGTVSIRPRKTLGGTLELLTAEGLTEEAEAPPVSKTEAAQIESVTGEIVTPEETK